MNRPRTLATTCALLAVLLAPVAALAPAHAEDVTVAPTATAYTITGHGYGHGHGLSQYGAQGAAIQGLSWRQIVGFYYPGTAIGRTRGKVRVLITADDDRDVMVEARDGLRVDVVGSRKSYRLAELRPRATRWRIKEKGERSIITYKAGGAWRKLTAVKGETEFSAGDRPITLRLPGHGKAAYRGTLRSVDKQTVNVVAMDRYLRGVVPLEVPAQWPAAAVQAQAVAARSYAAFERGSSGSDYDLCDTASCQVYGGYDAEQPESDAAVRKTRRKIVAYDGAPAFTQFSSSNGGYTSAGSMPYLVAQPDPYEASSSNPYATWTTTITRAQLDALAGGAPITRISVARDGLGDFGGRITSVTLVGGAAAVTMSGDALRSALGLRSTWSQITPVAARG